MSQGFADMENQVDNIANETAQKSKDVEDNIPKLVDNLDQTFQADPQKALVRGQEFTKYAINAAAEAIHNATQKLGQVLDYEDKVTDRMADSICFVQNQLERKRQCLVEAFIATTNTDGLVDLSGDTSKKAEEVYVPFGT
ncbi:MAG: hypothetical protein EZS28_043435, partial [Streblomastix strix]